jgi:hypothetical protein
MAIPKPEHDLTNITDIKERLEIMIKDVGGAKQKLIASVTSILPLLRKPEDEETMNNLRQKLDEIMFQSKHFVELISMNNVYGYEDGEHLSVIKKLFNRLGYGDVTPEKITKLKELLTVDVSLDSVIEKLNKSKDYKLIVDNVLKPVKNQIEDTNEAISGFLGRASIELIKQQQSVKDKNNFSNGQF